MLCKISIFAQLKNIDMATVKAFIRSSRKDKEVNIRFRLSDGRNTQLFHKSEFTIKPALWDGKNEGYKAKCVVRLEDRIALNTSVSSRKQLMLSIYSENPNIDSERLDDLINKRAYKEGGDVNDIFQAVDRFINKKRVSEARKGVYISTFHDLKRYQLYLSSKKRGLKLDINTINAEILEDIEYFMRNEHLLVEKHPWIYENESISIQSRKPRKPRKKGNNTICLMFKVLRAFFNWCNEQGLTDNKPFQRYNGRLSEKYGTPYYISLDERNIIADFDLKSCPELEIPRDIFVFQCLIGCRISDLFKMTRSNIINDTVEYIPHKTKDERPQVIRVPLNERAKILIAKYKDADSKGKIFPFPSERAYNKSIKEILKVCGITRPVTVINPTTGKEEIRPINEIASSHMARRTFIGNLYKKVKDPNLVGSLSGHKEGSKAFARYREIDDEIKKELVSLLE